MAPERRAADGAGKLSSEISTRFVQLFKEFSGKGPTRCRTYVEDDLVTVVLRGGYTRAENMLFEDGKWHEVRTARHSWQDTMQGRFTVELEQMTGRQVHAFMSASHQDPDIQVEIFVLEPVREPAEDMPSVA